MEKTWTRSSPFFPGWKLAKDGVTNDKNFPYRVPSFRGDRDFGHGLFIGGCRR
jgi:hypothetical protein